MKFDLTFVLTESAKAARRHLSMFTALVVCVAISLTMVGASWLLSRQVDDLKGYWYDKVEVSVFLCGVTSAAEICPDGAVTDTQREQVRVAIEALPVTQVVYYESQTEAWERFSKAYEGSPVLAQVDETSMPETFRVKLVDATQFAAVAEAVAPMRGVDSVTDQRRLLAQFFRVVSGLQTAALAVAAAQVLIALLLVTNTVRSAVAARRREVSIMRLIGASRAMIRGPFLGEAALAGAVGAGVAVGLLASLQHFVINALTSTSRAQVYLTWADLGYIAPALIAAGISVPVAAAWWTLRRTLRH